MISLHEVKAKAERKNAQKNNRLHFFASRFSIYFSWIFINFGLSANQVTFIFFCTGLIGSFLFLSQNNFWLLIGYLLWRLHIIFDLCDGDVARYTQKFSINGAYWDYMIHSILYPLFFINISLGLYIRYENDLFLILGSFGCLVVSQLLSVKNNYYRAMLFSGMSLDKSLGENNDMNWRFLILDSIRNILSFEGFLFFYVLVNFLNGGESIFIAIIIFYTFVFSAIVLTKFYSFSRKGYYSKRS